MKKYLIVVFALLAPALMWAQEEVVTQEATTEQERADDPESLSVTLEQAVSYAIEHNRSLQNASLATKQKEASRWQTIASMLPQVSGSLDYMNMCGYEMNLKGMKMSMNPYGSIGITASMALTGNQIVAALINNLSIEMADVTRKKTEQTIVKNVIKTYYTILTLEETLELLEKNYVNLQDLQRRAEKAVEVGTAEKTSAEQVVVQVNTFANTIAETKLNKEVSLSMLRLYMGLNMDTNLTLLDRLDNLMSPEQTLAILDTEFDITRNYDYQLTVQQTELAQKQKTLAAMDYVPSLSAYYKYTAKTYFGQDEGFNSTPPNTVGVTLSVPIWSSGKRAAAITEKRLAYQSAQNSQLDKEDQLQISNYQYRFNLKNAYDKYKVQEENLKVTQDVLDNTTHKFEFGYASGTDVTTASQSYINAQTQYVSAVLSAVEAYLELHDLLNVE